MSGEESSTAEPDTISPNDRAEVEETPVEVVGLPPRTDQPAPDVKGGTEILPPAIWLEGESYSFGGEAEHRGGRLPES